MKVECHLRKALAAKVVLGVLGAPGGAVKLVLPLERFAMSGLGCSPGHHRVPEGDSGTLRDTILESSKVILDLSGGHFGLLEGHFQAFESDVHNLELVRNSSVCFPRFFGIILATTDMIFVHMKLILNSKIVL